MNEHVHRSARRVQRLRADDPRIESSLRWLQSSTLTPPTKEKVRDAIVKAIEESGELATEEAKDSEVR